eukprot:COSAG04_NODE_16915_length_485_cov_0.937824_2_plen_69_part_00
MVALNEVADGMREDPDFAQKADPAIVHDPAATGGATTYGLDQYRINGVDSCAGKMNSVSLKRWWAARC